MATASVATTDVSSIVEEAIKRELMTQRDVGKTSRIIAEEEVKIEKKVRVAGTGQVMFSTLFGVKLPSSLEDFPVTVLKNDDIAPEIKALIPKENAAYHLQIEEAYHLVQAWEDSDKTLISGPTGSGKSSLVAYCCAKTNRPFIRINMNGDVETSAIFGQLVVEDGGTKWRNGAATEAAVYGAVLLVDEWELMPPEVGMGFQNVLEDGGYLFLKEMPGTSEEKMIVPHKDFRIVYAGNTVGQGDESGSFAGVQVQNTATLDRFQTTIIIDYLTKEHETNVINKTVPGLQATVVRRMLQMAELVRTANRQGNMTLTMSPRTLINWGRKILRHGDIRTAFDVAYMNKLNGNDKKLVSDFYAKVFGAK